MTRVAAALLSLGMLLAGCGGSGMAPSGARSSADPTLAGPEPGGSYIHEGRTNVESSK